MIPLLGNAAASGRSKLGSEQKCQRWDWATSSYFIAKGNASVEIAQCGGPATSAAAIGLAV